MTSYASRWEINEAIYAYRWHKLRLIEQVKQEVVLIKLNKTHSFASEHITNKHDINVKKSDLNQDFIDILLA